MRILWVGYGDLGTRATPGLQADGHEVVALRRGPPSPLPPGVEFVEVDLADDSSTSRTPAPDQASALSTVDTCVVTLTPTSRDRAGYEAAYLHSLDNLQRLLEVHGPGRLSRVVFASSTAVYGQQDGSWVQEMSTTEPTSFNGELLVAAEARIAALPGGVTARLGGIYGPGRGHLLRRVRAGTANATPAWTNRIHATDGAAALAHLVTAAPHLVPQVVNVVDHEPVRRHELVAWLAQRLGMPVPPVEVTDDHGKRVDGSRLLTTGFTHRHPTFRDGYADLLDE